MAAGRIGTVNRAMLDREGIGMTSPRTRRRLVERLRGQGISDERVLGAMERTPRHLFVDEALAHRAYEETALPIGAGQTISQPFVVALMTQLLLASGRPVRKVLEVGTGCGYQSAVLAELTSWVFTIERVRSLYLQTKERLRVLGYRNVSCLAGDGYAGWTAAAPFDGILVTAAPPAVPDKLKQQLAVGGRIVIPVGSQGRQRILLVERTRTGFREEKGEAVSFVPLVPGVNG